MRRPSALRTPEEAIARAYFIHPTVLGRTAWFRRHSYDGFYRRAEDHELWARTFPSSRFATIPEPLLYYRESLDGSIQNYIESCRSDRRIYRAHAPKLAAQRSLLVFKSRAKEAVFRIASRFGLKGFLVRRRSAGLSLAQRFDAERVRWTMACQSVPGLERCLEAARPRILAVCTLDLMAWVLLSPWFLAMREAGWDVHVACARTRYFPQLSECGFTMHEVPFRRRFNPFAHVVPLLKLRRLIRNGNYDAVNTHSPIAAALGRIAARLGGAPPTVYTVHGFFFHENMHAALRSLFVRVEWMLGRLTSYFMFVSEEDRRTALKEGIAADSSTTTTIYNGVNLAAYPPKALRAVEARQLRKTLGMPIGSSVVGIVGRLVREKGYAEFLAMAKLVAAEIPEAHFLIVGDSLKSDRDQFASEFKRLVAAAGLNSRFHFTGFTDRVADYLSVLDIFVLPSHREGFPRSVLEAMSSELPIVVTNIRGCRELVVDGVTGIIVPPKNSDALASAVLDLLRDPTRAAALARAGRMRAEEKFDQRLIQQCFLSVFRTGFQETVSESKLVGRSA